MRELWIPGQQLGSFYPTHSGLLLPETAQPRRPVAIDLFCGAGGFSLGFAQAGFHVIAAADNDPAATITYLYNLGDPPVEMHFVTEKDRERLEKVIEREWKRRSGRAVTVPIIAGGNKGNVLGDAPGCKHFWFGDLRRVRGQEILDALGMKPGEVDCVVGGPPCQGFSRLNTRRRVEDPRNSLVFEFARLVLEIQPKSFAMENVPGLLDMVTPEGLPVLDALCRVLEDGGFGVYESLKRSLLNTAGIGAAVRSKSRRLYEEHEELEDDLEQMPLFGGVACG